MSNVTDINSASKAELESILQASLVVDTSKKIPHSEGDHMIVGQKYEMYAPAAKHASILMGIAWHDATDYSFTYEGTIQLRDELYIVTKDTHYEGEQVPAIVQAQFDKLSVILNGASPLCPAYVALKLIRPYTGA